MLYAYNNVINLLWLWEYFDKVANMHNKGGCYDMHNCMHGWTHKGSRYNLWEDAPSETYVSSQQQPLAVWGCSSPDGARYVILLPQTWGVFNSDTPKCFWLTLHTNKRKEKGFHFRLIKIKTGKLMLHLCAIAIFLYRYLMAHFHYTVGLGHARYGSAALGRLTSCCASITV